MTKRTLPRISLAAKPEGLKFGVSKEVRERWRRISEEVAGGHGFSLTNSRAYQAAKPEPEAVEINILGNIGFDFWTGEGTTAAGIKKELKAAGKAPVLVFLNSPGGDAFEGVAIYNLLREHPGDVTVRVLGLAASAASVIAMAGDNIEIGEGASIMIHSAWGVVVGNQADMQQFGEMLGALDKAIAGVYAKRSGQKEDEVLAMMQKETWMFAADAVDLGFADRMIGEAPAKKSRASSLAQPVSLSGSVPSALLAASRDRQRSAVRLSAGAGAPGASGTTLLNQRGNMKPIKEQIAAFEAKHAANAARMEAIMQASADAGVTLDAAQTEEYDGLKAENVQITAHIARLKDHEAMQVQSATVLPSAALPADQSAARGGGSGVISVRSNAPAGIAFARYIQALALARGNLMQAAHIAKARPAWMAQTPQVYRVLMTAIEGGDTTTSGWASELVYNQDLVGEFIELLRPQTIMGRLTRMRKVPFNVRMSGQDAGGTAYWVGQGKAIPASKGNTISLTLGIAKAAGLQVITDELARSSSPSAEMMVRDDLIKTIKTFLDVQFVDPNVAAVTNVSPASITNGVTPIVPTGTDAAALRADVQSLFKAFIQNNIDPSTAVWIMETTQALAISMMRNALGQKEFPDININGGFFEGLPVVPSMSANIAGSPDSGKMIILANEDDIMIADDGGLSVEASREASIEMTDAPTGDAAAGTAGTTSLVSMFQESSIALKLVRYVNWKKRRSTAVQYIKEAQYVG